MNSLTKILIFLKQFVAILYDSKTVWAFKFVFPSLFWVTENKQNPSSKKVFNSSDSNLGWYDFLCLKFLEQYTFEVCEIHLETPSTIFVQINPRQKPICFAPYQKNNWRCKHKIFKLFCVMSLQILCPKNYTTWLVCETISPSHGFLYMFGLGFSNYNQKFVFNFLFFFCYFDMCKSKARSGGTLSN